MGVAGPTKALNRGSSEPSLPEFAKGLEKHGRDSVRRSSKRQDSLVSSALRGHVWGADSPSEKRGGAGYSRSSRHGAVKVTSVPENL